MLDKCEQCCYKNGLKLPDKKTIIYPGDTVVLGRFATVKWKVGYGWFSYEGNRRICGWYFISKDGKRTIKPIQEIDLLDIYVVENQ